MTVEMRTNRKNEIEKWISNRVAGRELWGILPT
jgi:hypothetical protein